VYEEPMACGVLCRSVAPRGRVFGLLREAVLRAVSLALIWARLQEHSIVRTVVTTTRSLTSSHSNPR
jgi:hypothetical protein